MCNYTTPVTWACGHTTGTTTFDGLCKEKNDLRRNSQPFETCPPTPGLNEVNDKELCWRCKDLVRFSNGTLPASMVVPAGALSRIGSDEVAKDMSKGFADLVRREAQKQKEEAAKNASFEQNKLDFDQDLTRLGSKLEKMRKNQVNPELEALYEQYQRLAAEMGTGEGGDTASPGDEAETDRNIKECDARESEPPKAKEPLPDEVRQAWMAWQYAKDLNLPATKEKEERFKTVVLAFKAQTKAKAKEQARLKKRVDLDKKTDDGSHHEGDDRFQNVLSAMSKRQQFMPNDDAKYWKEQEALEAQRPMPLIKPLDIKPPKPKPPQVPCFDTATDQVALERSWRSMRKMASMGLYVDPVEWASVDMALTRPA